jgi:hypothetical protein
MASRSRSAKRSKKRGSTKSKVSLMLVRYMNRAPSRAEIRKIVPGSSVKIGASFKGQSERFWVLVTDRKGDAFTGKVDNDLLDIPWPLGKVVGFRTANILDVMHPKTAKKLLKTSRLRTRVSRVRKGSNRSINRK